MLSQTLDEKNILNQKILDIAVYSVGDIQKILNIGRNQAYKLIQRNEFPVRHIGNRIVIPIVSFNEWLYQ